MTYMLFLSTISVTPPRNTAFWLVHFGHVFEIRLGLVKDYIESFGTLLTRLPSRDIVLPPRS